VAPERLGVVLVVDDDQASLKLMQATLDRAPVLSRRVNVHRV